MSVKMVDHIVDEHSIDADAEMMKRVKVTPHASESIVLVWL